MTPEDLDAFRRAADGEPCPMPWWAIAMLVAACVVVGAAVYWVFV